MTLGPYQRYRQRYLADQERAVDMAMIRLGISDPITRQVAMEAIANFHEHHEGMTSIEKYEIEQEREAARPKLRGFP